MQEGDVIVYVEDDEAYAQIMECVLKQSGFEHRYIHLSSGALAQAYLTGVGEFADRTRYPLPNLILADLKMPGMSGLELLTWLRSESPHSLIPFVILTSSDDMKDVAQAYRLGANSFLFKPPSLPDLVGMMKAVEGFWMNPRSSSDTPNLPL